MLVAVMLVAGFVLLFLLLLSTQRAGRRAAARVSLIFIVVWLLATAGYVWYSLTSDSAAGVLGLLPSALLIFLPPALPAAVVWRKNRRA